MALLFMQTLPFVQEVRSSIQAVLSTFPCSIFDDHHPNSTRQPKRSLLGHVRYFSATGGYLTILKLKSHATNVKCPPSPSHNTNTPYHPGPPPMTSMSQHTIQANTLTASSAPRNKPAAQIRDLISLPPPSSNHTGQPHRVWPLQAAHHAAAHVTPAPCDASMSCSVSRAKRRDGHGCYLVIKLSAGGTLARRVPGMWPADGRRMSRPSSSRACLPLVIYT